MWLPNATLAQFLLERENIPYELIYGAEALRLTQGKINPYSEFLVHPTQYPEVYLKDVYEAVEFINKQGLKRC